MWSKITNAKATIMKIPFYIMVAFAMIHLSVYVKFSCFGKELSFSFINQIGSLLYVATVYLWALWINRKIWIKSIAFAMGVLSACCLLISLSDFGYSFNDALYAGSSVLTVLYVFENAEYLLQEIKAREKYITGAIWGFLVLSVVLVIFFPDYQMQWGEGFFLFGHRYASVCSLMIILSALKLLNQPKRSVIYWIILFLTYYACFWTGARIYVISNLGVIYAVLYTFRKGNKDFFIKCVIVTLATIILLSTSSISQKNLNIMNEIGMISIDSSYAASYGEVYGWFNSMSNGRLNIWTTSVKTFNNLPFVHKLIGNGNKYIYDHNIIKGIHAHNDFLNILHFNGVIGLSVYLFALIGYVFIYWRKNRLSVIMLIGFWGVWFVLAMMNGYANYTADMMSLPYLCVMAYNRIFNNGEKNETIDDYGMLKCRTNDKECNAVCVMSGSSSV